MTTVAQVLTRVAEVQAGITGIARAYDANNPPDAVEDLPAFVNIYASVAGSIVNPGRIEYRMGSERHTFPVSMMLLLTKQDIAEAAGRTVALVEAVRAAFRAQATLGGRVTWAKITSYQFGGMTYAGEGYIGIEFVLEIEMSEPQTPAAGT